MTESHLEANQWPVTPPTMLRARPFLGSLLSSAFRVRDEVAFESDPAIDDMMKAIDATRWRPDVDGRPVFCLVNGMAPFAPLLAWRAFGQSLVDPSAVFSVGIDDSRGWIAGLRRHLDPECALVVQEFRNPDVPGCYLFWTILPEVAACRAMPDGTSPVWIAGAGIGHMREGNA